MCSETIHDHLEQPCEHRDHLPGFRPLTQKLGLWKHTLPVFIYSFAFSRSPCCLAFRAANLYSFCLVTSSVRVLMLRESTEEWNQDLYRHLISASFDILIHPKIHYFLIAFTHTSTLCTIASLSRGIPRSNSSNNDWEHHCAIPQCLSLRSQSSLQTVNFSSQLLCKAGKHYHH